MEDGNISLTKQQELVLAAIAREILLKHQSKSDEFNPQLFGFLDDIVEDVLEAPFELIEDVVEDVGECLLTIEIEVDDKGVKLRCRKGKVSVGSGGGGAPTKQDRHSIQYRRID